MPKHKWLSLLILYLSQTTTQSVVRRSTFCDGDPTCYCIPQGTCFTKEQPLAINHCWVKGRLNNRLRIDYTVSNQAGLTVTGTGEVKYGNE